MVLAVPGGCDKKIPAAAAAATWPSLVAVAVCGGMPNRNRRGARRKKFLPPSRSAPPCDLTRAVSLRPASSSFALPPPSPALRAAAQVVDVLDYVITGALPEPRDGPGFKTMMERQGAGNPNPGG